MQTTQLASCSSKRKHINDDGDNNDPEKHTLPSSKRVKNQLSPTNLEFPIGFDGPEDKIYAGDFVSYIPDDVTVHIFSLLDTGKAFFARLKLISKAWNALLSTRWSQLSTKSTLFGLVACRFDSCYNIRYLKFSQRGTAKSYFIGTIWSGYFLLDSNKGLLLFMERSPKELMVFHSSTGVLDHLPYEFTSVPENVVHIYSGLIPESHGCYKVVTHFILANVGSFFLKIFSSGTKEIKMVEVEVPVKVVMTPNQEVTAFFSFKGILYCSILDWIFVYQLKDGCSTFIKLPVTGCVVPKLQRLMWQSEGHLYYAFGYSDPQPGFQIWELVLEQQQHYNSEEITMSKWKMICSHFLTDIKNDYTRLFKVDTEESSDSDSEESSDLSVCKPCAFNDDFQILYIELQGMILSYHLKTRVFTRACKFKFRESYWENRSIFPFYFDPEKDSSMMNNPELYGVLGLYKGKSYESLR